LQILFYLLKATFPSENIEQLARHFRVSTNVKESSEIKCTTEASNSNKVMLPVMLPFFIAISTTSFVCG
jgi:hypothetical protein